MYINKKCSVANIIIIMLIIALIMWVKLGTAKFCKVAPLVFILLVVQEFLIAYRAYKLKQTGYAFVFKIFGIIILSILIKNFI